MATSCYFWRNSKSGFVEREGKDDLLMLAPISAVFFSLLFTTFYLFSFSPFFLYQFLYLGRWDKRCYEVRCLYMGST